MIYGPCDCYGRSECCTHGECFIDFGPDSSGSRNRCCSPPETIASEPYTNAPEPSTITHEPSTSGALRNFFRHGKFKIKWAF
jgi:hypothetical protein